MSGRKNLTNMMIPSDSVLMSSRPTVFVEVHPDVIFPVLPGQSDEVATMIAAPRSREECVTFGKFKGTVFGRCVL